MVSAPTTEATWAVFVASIVALYVAILFLLTDAGPVDSLLLGTFYGLVIAIAVALLVVVWRGVPDLLYPDSEETPKGE